MLTVGLDIRQENLLREELTKNNTQKKNVDNVALN